MYKVSGLTVWCVSWNRYFLFVFVGNRTNVSLLLNYWRVSLNHIILLINSIFYLFSKYRRTKKPFFLKSERTQPNRKLSTHPLLIVLIRFSMILIFLPSVTILLPLSCLFNAMLTWRQLVGTGWLERGKSLSSWLVWNKNAKDISASSSEHLKRLGSFLLEHTYRQSHYLAMMTMSWVSF